MRKHLNSTYSLLIVALFFACSGSSEVEVSDAGSFEENLELFLSEEDSLLRNQMVEEYLIELNSPVLDSDTIAYFIYFGQTSSVSVAGDFNQWNPTHTSFQRVAMTNLWYRRAQFEPNARLDYKLVIGGANWILDPRNPNQIMGGFGPNSELAMPGYKQPEEIAKNENVATGTIESLNLSSNNTGKTYEVKVYLPAGYDVNRSYPAVYFQDGSEYLNIASSSTVLDNLIAAGRIEPIIAVFVVPTNRNTEYAFDDRFKYKDFFVEELIPAIDERYSTAENASSRAVIGDSYGGNISAIIAFSHPEVFGNCGIHSGAFQPNSFHTNTLVMDGVKKDIRVASIWGSYEGASLPPNMRKVKDYLIENGYEIAWKELPEGHSWGLWRATIDDMLVFFFPAN